MNSLSSIITLLVRLTLLCFWISSEHASAGKGKVPVYMPFPVPVPMPVHGGGGGGSQHGNKLHHHHHLHQSDGEGEVKKIYLLQPVEPPPKQHHHHHQTAIYNSPPIEQQPIQQQLIDTTSLQQPPQYHQASKPAHSNDMKILPIVVIPPIAPMPPIQVQSNQAANTANAPKMTLSPQFNNYLVSGRDELVEKRGHTRHLSDMYQDHKNFADYGGSGSAAVFRRERPLRMYRQRAPVGGLGRSHISYDYIPTNSRQGRFRVQDDYGDDYEYSQASWRPRARSFHNRRTSRSREGDYRVGVSSIKDVIDYHTVYDDEPSTDIGLETRDSGSNNNRASRLVINGRNVNLENFEENNQAEKDYPSDNHYTSASRSRPMMTSDKDRLADQSRGSNEIISYDRDYQEEPPQSRLSIKYTSSNLTPNNGGSSTGKKVYVDDRELMHSDDEWRYESVKSITHSSLPKANSTETNIKSSKGKN